MNKAFLRKGKWEGRRGKVRLYIINEKRKQTNPGATWLRRYLEGVEISDKFLKFFDEISEN